MTTSAQQLDELCYLSAQSLPSFRTSEHFRVIKTLGEGSYGKVMLAVHKKKGTPMALKFFPRDSTSLLSFLREYNLSLSFCSHPSLTKALGIFFSTPSYYVFAEQAGLYGDLFDVIIPEVGMEEERVQSVVSQLSGAVTHLHSLGFVHRDIKPENIFLCDQTCRWVKLGDFGLTRARGSKVRGVWFDSPYCVPEVEAARERIDAAGDEGGADTGSEEGAAEGQKEKTDIWISVEPSLDTWALGILTYCMLTGFFPWQETTADDPSYRQYKEWFDRETDRSHGTGGRQAGRTETGGVIGTGGDIMSLEPREKQSEEGVDLCLNPIAPQFAVFSPLALSLFRELLNPEPALRAGPEEILGYLGAAWLLNTEKEEKRQAQEAEAEARKIREGGCVGEEEREGKGER